MGEKKDFSFQMIVIIVCCSDRIVFKSAQQFAFCSLMAQRLGQYQSVYNFYYSKRGEKRLKRGGWAVEVLCRGMRLGKHRYHESTQFCNTSKT